MIRRIKKTLAFVLIGVSICTIMPKSLFNMEVKADTTKVSTSSNTSSFEALETVEAAMIPTKLNKIYSNINPLTSSVSQFEECGTLSYTLSDTVAESIESVLKSNMDEIEAGVTAVYKAGVALSAIGETVKGQALQESALSVKSELQTMSSYSDSELTEMIKEEAKSIPVYKYTVVNSSGATVAQGFAVGGLLGLALNPVDSFNGILKTGEYSSDDLVPVLSLSGSSKYNKTIDLSSSNVDIICDGFNINIVDSSNNKLYVINNPVYNMILMSNGIKTSTTEDILNVIDFMNVTKLRGSKTNIDLSSEGISTTVLSVSLKTENSKSKTYKYALPVDEYEKSSLDGVIDSLNLGTIGDTIKGLIKSGSYVMIPNVASDIIDNSGISDTVNGITDSLDELSDALEDLTDALEDKNDDLDDAWDKVFDRFDNDKGWGTHDGYKYYYDKDGVSLKGVHKINGKTYYFNRIDGAMETGWQIVDGKKCYFDKKKGYQVFNQWIEDEDDWYYVGDDGAVIKKDWINYNGKYYYLKSDGKMTKDGWLKIDDYWYYFNQDGSMAVSTWKLDGGKWYYLKDNGAAANDWINLGTNWYYFKELSGEMQIGWFRADGSWYYANEDGSMRIGWLSDKGKWYYFDDATGKMKKNEWVTVNGNYYYFNINGEMVTGSKYIDGTKYIFGSDGVLE